MMKFYPLQGWTKNFVWLLTGDMFETTKMIQFVTSDHDLCNAILFRYHEKTSIEYIPIYWTL